MTTSEDLGGIQLDVMSPQEVKQAFDSNSAILIDVRTPNEFAFEHIAGAMLAPMSSFDPVKLPTQDGKRIIFHCGSGMRSHKIVEQCAAAGVSPLAHMDGGFGAWKTAGLPYLTIDPATGSTVHKP